MAEIKILIVEDERIVALDLRHQLQGMGYNVLDIVSYGEDAVHKAGKLRPDLILMDIRLKGDMDGVEAARRIHAQFDIPIVYLTAYADSDTLERAKLTTPFGYVLKPFEQRELHATIEMALYKHRTDRELRAYAAQLERANRQLALVNQLIAASVDGLEPRAALQIACRELAQILDVSHAAAILLDRNKHDAEVVAEFAVSGQWHAMDAKIRVSGTPLIQVLVECTEPAVIDDFQNDPRLSSLSNLMEQRGPFSLLILPLIIGEDVVGGMGLVANLERPFSSDDIELSWNVASQLAAALARTWLAEERKRLSAAIEQAAEAVIITDTEGTIVYVNPAFAHTTGYSQESAVGQTPRLLSSGRQEKGMLSELWSTITDGQTWHGRLVNRKQDGTLYTADVTIAPVHNGNGEVVNYVSVQRDVTQELEREEQYRQALKMEAVGRLAAGIAHDFNNLLTAINGYATLLEMQLPPDGDSHGMAENILSAGERAADLTRQLLTFSRKQVAKAQAACVNTVVQEMHEILSRTIGEHIVFQTHLDSDLWRTKADPVQLQRVIVNLAVNARDAMPGGGRLTIETTNVALSEASTYFDLHVEPGDYVLLSVADTGTGMSQDVQSHLFEPFFTTKEEGRGTGLGLATVYGIVKQCGGTIHVDSLPDQGSTFQLYLPRIADAVLEPEPPATQRRVSRGGETILLVEDNEHVSALTHRVLTEQGYRLLHAQDGREAQRLATKHNGAIDLLLTDVIMPGINGKALADQLCQVRPRLKVLFMSGYPNEANTHCGALEAQAAFLPKPFRPGELMHKVRTVLDG